jgi:hypothetical protein
MTEEEAKTKWCVHTNAADNPSKCDGSACMAWRWLPAVDWSHQFKELLDAGNWLGAIKLHRHATGSSLKDAKDFVDGVRGGTSPMPTPALEGFCGLAGRP